MQQMRKELSRFANVSSPVEGVYLSKEGRYAKAALIERACGNADDVPIDLLLASGVSTCTRV
jgi:hypothetical protein